MKLLLLLSTTVFFVATGAEGLKCYNCIGSDDCSIEMTCPDGITGTTAACVKAFAAGTTVSRNCGLKSVDLNCADGDTGFCACTTDLCNAAVRPGTTTASALTLLGLTAVAMYILA